MSEPKEHAALFNPSGCLNLDAMQRFQSGNLTEQEASLVNRHLEECPICRDAMEGFDLLPDLKAQKNLMLTLSRRIRSKYIIRREPLVKNRSRKLNPVLAYISAAATILIIFGIYGILNSGIFRTERLAMENSESPETEDMDIISSVEREATEAESPEDIAEKEIEKPVSPVPAESEIREEEIRDLQEGADQKMAGGVASTEEMVARVEEEVSLIEELEAELTEAQADTLDIGAVSPEGQTEFVSLSEEAEDNRERAAPVKSMETVKAKGAKIAKQTVGYTTNDEVYLTEVEEMPEFKKKGYEDFDDFIRKNLEYPDEAREKGKTGEVSVYFVINEDGSVDDVWILSGVDPLLDEEAVRVIRSSPRWKPGKQDGEHVKVRLTYSVVFKLNE